jgi:hypothetical protein
MIDEAISKFNTISSIIGKTGLNALFPNDFEVYIIALELVDSQDRTLEFFSFPITPSNISISEPQLTNIKKTARGLVSLKTDSFVPVDITLSGNFGRNFKILIRNQIIDFTSFSSNLGVTNTDFNGPNIKTGYGTMKVFDHLLNGSKVLDLMGNPTRLYFYNFAFGVNYVVEVMDKSFTQARDSSNMIWNYNVSLKAVAPINNAIRSRKSMLNMVTTGVVQKGINNLCGNIQRYMSSQTANKSTFKG